MKRRNDRKLNLWPAYAGGIVFAALAWTLLHPARPGTEQAKSGNRPELSHQADAPAPTESGRKIENGKPADELPLEAGRPSETTAGAEETKKEAKIRVYLTGERKIEEVPLETYVLGVVAAEMPLDFEPAALEAQALAARTYIVRRLWNGDRTGVTREGADVTDTVTHQAYRSLSDMRSLSIEKPQEWRKAKEAVRRTEGDIIAYGNAPIEALFFSTSNGYTENSEEVFPAKLPYLRSVPSPWDSDESPRAKETVEMSLSDFYGKLDAGATTAIARLIRKPVVRVLEYTEGHRVKRMRAGSSEYTGEEARGLLGLRSASFDWKIRGDKVTITTYGSGHGVGMSQWGAEELAKAGKKSEQIVEYYYSGARVQKVSNLPNAAEKGL